MAQCQTPLSPAFEHRPLARAGAIGVVLFALCARAQPCAAADAVDRRRFPKPSCAARLILFRCRAGISSAYLTE